jgi:hypothetical protein
MWLANLHQENFVFVRREAMIDLLYLSYDKDVPTDDYWDLGTINQLLEGKLWGAVGMPQFHRVKSLEDINGEGAVIVFPARRQVSYLKQLNADLKRLQWVVLILVGDEAGEFPAKLIEHPNIRFWQMSPAPKTLVNDQTRKIGSGVPPQGYEWLPQYREDAYNRPVDYFFAGQLTHSRRHGLKRELDTLEEFHDNNHLEGVVHYSEGFTQGLPPEYYYKGLASAKVVPCPSGAINPESFRMFEALEAGCVPVVDALAPKWNTATFGRGFSVKSHHSPCITSSAKYGATSKTALINTQRSITKSLAGGSRRNAKWLIGWLKTCAVYQLIAVTLSNMRI